MQSIIWGVDGEFGTSKEKEQLSLGRYYTSNYDNFEYNFSHSLLNLGTYDYAFFLLIKTRYAYMHTMSRRMIRLLP